MLVLISEPGFPLKSIPIAGADGLTENGVRQGASVRIMIRQAPCGTELSCFMLRIFAIVEVIVDVGVMHW